MIDNSKNEVHLLNMLQGAHLGTLNATAIQIWDLLSFGEPQGPKGGGRFLPRFVTDWGFLCLRLLCAAFLVCLPQPSGINDWHPMTIAISFGFAVIHGSFFVIRRCLPSERLYFTLIIAHTITDILFATCVALIRHEIGALTVILYLIAATEASLLGSFLAWFSVASLVVILGSAVAVTTGGVLYLVPVGTIGALIVILRLYRGTQIKAKSSLERERARYASLVESIPQMITRKDINGVITYANKAFCNLNPPLSREQVIGMTDKDLYGAKMAAKYLADDTKVIQTKKILPIDEKHRPYRQTEERHMEGCKIPVCNAAGEVVEVQVIFWDVTERKRWEAQLMALMALTPDHIYFKDLRSRFLQISATQAGRFGLKEPAEAVGKTDFDYFTSPHAQQALEDEQEIIRTCTPIIDKEELETWPDGSRSWVSTTKQCLRDKEGKVIGTFGISRDITEKKIAHAKLTSSERLYRLIVENAADLIYLREAGGEIRSVNAAVKQILGYSPTELLGRNVLSLTAPAFLDKMSARLSRKDKKPVTCEEVDFIAKDGSIVNLEFTARAIPDRATNRALVVSIGHDLTARKRTEEKLRHLLTEMQRLAEVAEKNAQQSEFIMRVSAHELRGPLQTIVSLLAVLKTKAELKTTDIMRLVKEIEEEVYRAKRQMDNALTFDNPIAYDFRACNLRLLFEAAEHEFQSRAADKDICIKFDENTKSLPPICMDRQRIAQVITNLLDNAVRDSFKGGTIHINGMETASSVEVAFTSFGRGIPACLQQIIFERKKDLSLEERKRLIAGTGLGLPIVKSIIERHDGQVSCSSEAIQDGGAAVEAETPHKVTFTITLPKIAKSG